MQKGECMAGMLQQATYITVDRGFFSPLYIGKYKILTVI
jgi:hypothetical protein